MNISTARAGAALAMLALLIPQSARDAGVATWNEYLDFDDQRATRHIKGRGMSKRLNRRPIPGFDDHGDLILHVPLDDRGDRFAIVYPQDWIDMQEADCDGLWCCDNNGKGWLSVKTRRSLAGDRALNHLNPARFILSLGDDSKVKYRNGNPLDLRRCNLDGSNQPASPAAKPARHNARTAMAVTSKRRKAKGSGGGR